MSRDLRTSLWIARRRARRGLFVLPSLFTFANLLCGYWAVILCLQGNLEVAAILILVATLLDALDGRIARWTDTTSAFGVQLDSLTDLVSFGVAPAILVYSWALHLIPRPGLALSFFFVCCGATRLARYNIQHAVTDRRYFVGLPIPIASGILASLVAFRPTAQESPRVVAALSGLVLVLSLLMVSRIRYRSFKGADAQTTRLSRLPWVALLLTVFFVWPRPTLISLGLLYLASGPLGRLWGMFPGRPPGPTPGGAPEPRDARS